MSSKIVTITGCLGFIGSYVTRACLAAGWYVMGLDKITYAARTELLQEFKSHPNFSFIQEDICKLDRIIDCDYFINLAAETHVDNSIRRSDEFINSNIYGVYNILELLRKYKVSETNCPIFFQVSTDEVMGDIVSGEHFETDKLAPSNPYSSSKACAEQLITAWARTYKIPYIILRPTNNYGIGQHTEKLIPKTCKYLKIGRRIPLHDNGSPIRNWLHAKDTAQAVIKIVQSGLKNEIYNVAGGFEQDNLTTVKKIIQEYFGSLPDDYEKFIDFSIKRNGQDIRYAINDQKLRGLGWTPSCNFDVELKSIVAYYKEKFIW